MKKEIILEPANPAELSLYCYMGEAICMIQELELALSHSITLKIHFSSSKKVADNALQKHHKNYTFGKAVQLAEKKLLYSAELQMKLNAFFKKRNWLVHNSMLERRDDIYSEKDRIELFYEIKSIADDARLLQHEIELDMIQFCKSKGKDMPIAMSEIEKRYKKI